MTAQISNALIRCTRGDNIPEPIFDLVRDDLGLWVRELPNNFEEIISDLSKIQLLLKGLAVDSRDFTLHIAASTDSPHSLALPPELVELADFCGFSLEIICRSGSNW